MIIDSADLETDVTLSMMIEIYNKFTVFKRKLRTKKGKKF